MDTTIETNKLTDAICSSDSATIDASWAILKYKEIGIYRKVACLCQLHNLNLEEVLSELPQDDEGRILDYKTRNIIHQALISAS
tara:strand:- start:2636 stop:2887 length:252 start_codon:yes stop_codon:yes gene_type:complete